MQSASYFDTTPIDEKIPSAALIGQWLGVIGLCLLLSFSWLPNSYLLMVGWPYCLWWQGAFILLLGWSIWTSRQFSRVFKPIGHNLDWIILVFCIRAVSTSMVSQFVSVAHLNAVLFSSYAVVLYIVVHWLRQAKDLRRKLWFALVASGIVTHVVSLSSWRPTTEMWSTQNFYTAIRNPWPLGHHNFVGGYCLLLLPLTFGFTLRQRGWRRWFGCGAIALNALTLYASGSRGALLGAIAAGLIVLLLYLFRPSAKAGRRWIIAFLLCALMIATFTSNPRVRSLLSINPASSQQHFSIERISDGPTKDRLFMLQT